CHPERSANLGERAAEGSMYLVPLIAGPHEFANARLWRSKPVPSNPDFGLLGWKAMGCGGSMGIHAHEQWIKKTRFSAGEKSGSDRFLYRLPNAQHAWSGPIPSSPS